MSVGAFLASWCSGFRGAFPDVLLFVEVFLVPVGASWCPNAWAAYWCPGELGAFLMSWCAWGPFWCKACVRAVQALALYQFRIVLRTSTALSGIKPRSGVSPTDATAPKCFLADFHNLRLISDENNSFGALASKSITKQAPLKRRAPKLSIRKSITQHILP